MRISPELHRRVATAAQSGKSVNTFVAETLEQSTSDPTGRGSIDVLTAVDGDLGPGDISGVVAA
jgi:hypothetical protein